MASEGPGPAPTPSLSARATFNIAGSPENSIKVFVHVLNLFHGELILQLCLKNSLKTLASEFCPKYVFWF